MAYTATIDNLSDDHTHTDSTAEQTVYTFAPTQINLVKGIWLDLNALTQNVTIRLKYQIDGTNYRTFKTQTWTTGMDDGVLLTSEIPVDDSLQITLQSAILEGASRTVPYEVYYEGVGAGAITFTYTLTSSEDASPIADADVWVATDAGNTNIIASDTTDSSGQVVFYLDAGTYYIFRQKDGWNFSNPDIETVA